MSLAYHYKHENGQFLICDPDGVVLTTDKGKPLSTTSQDMAEFMVTDLNRFNVRIQDGVFWKNNSPACSLIAEVIDCDDEDENFNPASAPKVDLNLPDNFFAVNNIAGNLGVDPAHVNDWLNDQHTTEEFHQQYASHVDIEKLNSLKQYLELVRSRKR